MKPGIINFNKKFLLILPVLICVLALSCKEELPGPLTNDSAAPPPVSNAQVENLPGAALISYSLPADPNLLYVKGEYEIGGEKKEARASYFKNSIKVEGFGDTDEHQVVLYAVSRSEKASTPITVTIHPLAPSIIGVLNSLNVVEAFGGIHVQFQNPDEGNIVIAILLRDSAGNWQNIDNYYTSQDSGEFSTRGLQPVPQTFGIFVRDRWNNHTDTVVKVLTPIYEEELDKSNFADIRSKFPVPQMPPLPASGQPMQEAVDYSSKYPEKNLWDNNTGKMFHTKQNYDQPIWVPIDLGVKAKLSRFKIWQRPQGYSFNHGNPHKWEIWGTNDPTDPNSWVLLGKYTMIKPSGLPVGINTNEDLEAATDGQDYDFPIGIPAVRYLGWKNIDCWSAIGGQTGFMHLEELTLWGQIQ